MTRRLRIRAVLCGLLLAACLFLVFSAGSAAFAISSQQMLTTLPTGDQPIAISVNHSNSIAYVANAGSKSVSVIDMAQLTLIDTWHLPSAPSALFASEVTAHVF